MHVYILYILKFNIYNLKKKHAFISYLNAYQNIQNIQKQFFSIHLDAVLKCYKIYTIYIHMVGNIRLKMCHNKRITR